MGSASAERRGSVAHRALVAEVGCALGVSEHVAQGWLSDAGVLATKAAATLDALCAGRISYQHAARLADTVADLPAAAAAQVERAVLDRAPSLTAARFGSLARAARDRLHPVPAEVRREAAALRAGVWVDDGKDGMSWLTAHVPTVVAHAVHDRLARAAARAKVSGDPRGIGQLRAATLSALLLDDTAGGTQDTDSADPPDPLPDPLATVDRRSYVVPTDLRAFLTQRDVTCRFPGCRVPAPRCDIDHTTAWADGGTTAAGNLAHLCRRHRVVKHESRWHVEQLDGGVLTWTSPRGRTYLTSPGSAAHTLDQLDDWATEARFLAAETPLPHPTGEPLGDGPDPAPLPADAHDDAPPPF